MLRRLAPQLRLPLFIATATVVLGSILYSAAAAAQWRPPAASWPPIDLAQQRWYARPGFAAADAGGFDPQAPGVRSVDHFPIRLNALFAVPPDNAVRTFALMTFFDLPAAEGPPALMLSLPELGENWAVYLNGVELRREIYLGASGQIRLYRSLQKALVPLPATALHPGGNTLVFQLLGSAPPTAFFTDWMPGFSMENGYLIAPTDRLLEQRSVQGAISWLQIGAYLFFSLIHLLLYLRQRERYALYFGLFLLSCVVYSFTNSGVAFDVMADTAALTRLRTLIFFTWPSLAGLTLWSFLHPQRPISRGLWWMVISIVPGCGVLWLAPLAWTGLMLNLYLPTFVVSAVYIQWRIVSAARHNLPDARKLLVAGLIVFGLVVWTVLDILVLRTGVDVVGWAPFVLAVAFALVFIDRIWRLSANLAESNRQLRLSHDDLEGQVAERSAELRAANAELERRVETRTAELSARTVELSQARDAAEAANRAKSAFLAVMGHELRTPLHGMFLTAEVLRERHQSPADQAHYADIILTSGRRLWRMVEGVLEYTATDTPHRQPVDVALALNENAIRFEPRVASRGLAIAFDLPADLPRLEADPLQFDRMLRRLLENAVMYTPAGGRIRVVARRLPAWPFPAGDRPALEITVCNTGIPLAPADYDRIFEPFVQLEASHLEHAEGAGLGLTLARRQAEAHGGTLTAGPAPNDDGHVFTLRLPLE